MATWRVTRDGIVAYESRAGREVVSSIDVEQAAVALGLPIELARDTIAAESEAWAVLNAMPWDVIKGARGAFCRQPQPPGVS